MRDTKGPQQLTSDERARLKELERENRELKKANEILKAASGLSRASRGPPSRRA